MRLIFLQKFSLLNKKVCVSFLCMLKFMAGTFSVFVSPLSTLGICFCACIVLSQQNKWVNLQSHTSQRVLCRWKSIVSKRKVICIVIKRFWFQDKFIKFITQRTEKAWLTINSVRHKLKTGGLKSSFSKQVTIRLTNLRFACYLWWDDHAMRGSQSERSTQKIIKCKSKTCKKHL